MQVTQRMQRTTVAVLLSGSIVAGSAKAAAAQSDTDWSRVQRLKPGTPITVTLQGLPARERQVIAVDDSNLTVLNTTDSRLPSEIQDTLREVAVTHPEYLLRASSGNPVVLERSLRIEQDGVFIDGRKLASLPEILETNTRRDVGRITRRQRGRGVWGHLGVLGGYFVGGMAGGYAVGLACRATRGRDGCDTGAFLSGMVIGGVAGGAYGLHASRRETEVVVYQGQ